MIQLLGTQTQNARVTNLHTPSREQRGRHVHVQIYVQTMYVLKTQLLWSSQERLQIGTCSNYGLEHNYNIEHRLTKRPQYMENLILCGLSVYMSMVSQCLKWGQPLYNVIMSQYIRQLEVKNRGLRG